MIEKNTINLLRSLVSFDTTSYKSNLKLIEFVESYLNKLNIKSTLIYDDTKNKANLYATIGPEDIGGVMLSGHTDVVPVTGEIWDSDPFNLIQVEDRFFGRGSADMKGFLALILSRVPEMLQANLSRPIHLAFSYDEEIGKNNNEEEVKNEDVKTYIANLNLDTKNWWFEIPEFKYDIIKTRLNKITRDIQKITPEEIIE